LVEIQQILKQIQTDNSELPSGKKRRKAVCRSVFLTTGIVFWVPN